MLKVADFHIDALPDETFMGYVGQDTWNGFVCPYFEYDEAVRILKSLEQLGEPETLEHWEYDDNQNQFYVFQSTYPNEPEVYKAEIIEPLGIRLFAIGAFSWTWRLSG